MAISSQNSVLHSDINAIFSSFNTLINSKSWGISAIPAGSIPAQGDKVDDANIATLNAKIDEFNSNEYLRTVNWWTKSTVTEGTLLRASDLTNINNSVSHMSSVICKNKASNNYSNKSNCCNSNNCNQGGHGHSTNTNCCNSNNCNQSGHGYSTNTNCCNSHGCSGKTCTSYVFDCYLSCQRNPSNCANSAVWPLQSGDPCNMGRWVVQGYACCLQSNNVYYSQCCDYYQNTNYGIWRPTCTSNTCSGHVTTCANTSTCGHGNCGSKTCSSQTCANSSSCSHGNCGSKTCSSQTCANSASCGHEACTAHTQTIDITCNQSSKTYSH